MESRMVDLGGRRHRVILAELAIPSFFIVWFGLGAVLVGLLMLACRNSLTANWPV